MNHKLLTIIALTTIIACKKEAEVTSTPLSLSEKINVHTTKVDSAAQNSVIEVLGIITSESEAKPAFKTGGVINRTYVKEGDFVKKGQLLATLIMSEIDAQVRQAEEGFQKAERDLARVKNLYADSVATLEQFQNAGTANEVAKRTLEIAKFNRQYSEVRSPINGKIVKQILHDGEITGPGTPVYAIMGTGNKDWKVVVGLIDRDWARVNIGDRGFITLDAYPGKKYDVVVSDKSQTGGSASSRIDVELKFDEFPPNLAAGLTGKVSLTPKKGESGYFLPVEAFTYANGRTAKVYVHENGKAVEKTVMIGEIKGNKMRVLSGLDPGIEVITTGAVYLENGDSIIVKN